jgi:hypothetical protein
MDKIDNPDFSPIITWIFIDRIQVENNNSAQGGFKYRH